MDDMDEDETLSTTGVCFNSKTLNFPDIKESCKIDVKYKIKYFLYIDLGYCWTRKI